MYKLKSEYEDLIFKTIEPKIYKNIQKKVKSSRADRENYLTLFVRPIQKQINKFTISHKISHRTKHYSSIYGKMKKRKFLNLSWSIITKQNCIHSIWLWVSLLLIDNISNQPSNKYLIYPSNYNHFVKYYKNTYQHGGISLQEMFIPFSFFSPK